MEELLAKSISQIPIFEDQVLDGPGLSSKYKKLHNQNQNLISKYLNTKAKSTYSYNRDDIIATNSYRVLPVLYVLNSLPTLSLNLITSL